MAFSRSARITLLLFIDVIFFLVELIVGYAVGSLALVADSFHMLNDILSLIVALYAIKLTAQEKTDIDTKYSYGWHRAEILAALVNGVFLLALCFSIFMEAIERFFSTPEISNPRLVVIVGSLGLASNFVGLFLFHEHSHSHSHDHDDQAKHSHSGHEQRAVSESTSVTLDDETLRGRSRERSDSLFGHPVATRQYVVQAAQDLQLARSPSVGRSIGPASPSSTKRHERTQSFFSVLNDTAAASDDPHAEQRISVSESTPLLKNQKIDSQREPSIHSVESHNSQQALIPKRSPAKHSHGSMNMRALVLHVLGDALGNVGVISTGLIIWLTDLSWKYYFDPIISLVITVIIFSSALPLVKSASFILLQGVPHDISLAEVDAAIRDVDGVQDVHELHIWQLSESKIVASVHVLASIGHDFMQVAADIRKALHDRGIHSSTIQPEYNRSPNGAPPKYPNGMTCLITCPPNQQECNPVDHSCCPPPSAEV